MPKSSKADSISITIPADPAALFPFNSAIMVRRYLCVLSVVLFRSPMHSFFLFLKYFFFL